MAADNWDVCPRCLKQAEAEKQKKIDKANKSYGKVTPEEYLELRAKAERTIDLETLRTLREDYEIGTDRYGSFSIRYSCGCTECNFSHNYDYAVQIQV